MNKISSTLVGVAGEYYAAAELTRRGLNASTTLRNTESYEILLLQIQRMAKYSIFK